MFTNRGLQRSNILIFNSLQIHLYIDSFNHNHMIQQLICLHIKVIYEGKGTTIAKK